MAQRQFRSDDTSLWTDRYGNGSDGALVISGNTTFSSTRQSCSGTAGSTTLTLATGTFTNGDLVIIHQTRGTGVGAWELNRVLSGGGTTTLTMAYPLINTYTDSGASQAQVQKLSQYSSVTVNSGIDWTATAWDGNTGGILAFVCNGPVSIVGNIKVNGTDGAVNTNNQHQTPGGAGIGFSGGDGLDNQQAAFYAEGTVGAAAQSSNGNANGNGGGGGKGNGGANNGGGGGGGGYVGAGGAGRLAGAGGAYVGSGGAAVGVAGLTEIHFGGGGGGSGDGPSVGGADYGSGAGGAGIVLIIGRTITISGTIQADGGDGGASFRGGGGGAGGSVLLKGQSITLGTALVTALFGVGGRNDSGVAGGNGSASSFEGCGGNGNNGRIHADVGLLANLSGTTSPTLDSRADSILLDQTSYLGKYF